MATASQAARATSLPPLQHGDRLDQKTFHARYEAMPEDFHAELIGGIVFVRGRRQWTHGSAHTRALVWLDDYAAATPGTEALTRGTQILSPESEPEPDLILFIQPEYGGLVFADQDQYLNGPPELVLEVCSGSESIALHLKKLDYERAGVCEYITVAVCEERVYWFVLQGKKYKEAALPADGIYRSRDFPGLWLDTAALLKQDRSRIRQVLHQGLATPEHAAFVAKLAKQVGKK